MPKTDMTKVGQNAALIPAPDYMKGPIVGIDQLKTLITPPMVKIVQSMSSPELQEEFGIGTVIQTPDNVVICSPVSRDDKTGQITKHGSFHFTPIFFYKEWIKWAPMAAKGVMSAILGKTTDPNSDIARRSMDAQLRLEPLTGENEKFGNASNVEHLNYICMIEGVKDPTIISFNRSSWKIGKELAHQIKMREKTIFGNRFQAIVDNASNEKGAWHVFNIIDPTDEKGPWTNEADYEKCAKIYEGFQEAYLAQVLVANYEQDAGPVAPAQRTDM